MLPRTSIRRPDWLQRTLEEIRLSGICIVEDFIGATELPAIRDHMYAVQKTIVKNHGEERLKANKEVGILRTMMQHDPFFLSFLERPEMLAVVDATVSPTAILHVQTGILLPPVAPGTEQSTFQFQFHRDFPRYLNGYLGAVDVFLALDEFSKATGATRVVPKSHQQAEIPSPQFLSESAVSVDCPAGSALIFDSTLWHASGINTSGKDRLAMNHIFTRSFFKPQFDYCRLLGEEKIRALKPRTQQLLGFYTRVPSSFDEYYRPPDDRLYRSGQG